MHNVYHILIVIFVTITVLSCDNSVKAGHVSEQNSLTNTSLLQTIQKKQLQVHSAIFDTLFILNQPVLNWNSIQFDRIQRRAIVSGARRYLRGHFGKIGVPSDSTLKYLDLSFRAIRYLPNSIAKNKNLRYLSLRGNRLLALNPVLAQCPYLRKVDLSANQWRQVPFGIIYLDQVEELNLSDNFLSTLPSYFYNLRGLKVLDISNVHPKMALGNNQFTQIPSVLFKMNGLERLFLDKLPLTTLSSKLALMDHLRIVSVNGCSKLNMYQAIEQLAQVDSLVALDISFVGRRRLPENIGKLQHLAVLIWHEEYDQHTDYVENELKKLLPNTQIFYSVKRHSTPFLRGNSIKTIRNAKAK